MLSSQWSVLSQSIAARIKDYRAGEIPTITADHVSRWASQFERYTNLTILQETDRILYHYYLSRTKTEKLIGEMLSRLQVFAPETAVNTEFLDIQQRGNSQCDLLALVDSVLWKRKRIRRSKPAQPRQYIYLDDCLLTGNRLYRDIEAWIPTAKSGTTLHVVLLGTHTAGIRFFQKRIADAASAYGIDIKIWPALAHAFENDENSEVYDCLWSEAVAGNKYVDESVRRVTEDAQRKGWPVRLFRSGTVRSQNLVFSSDSARSVVEQTFLKAGAYICSLPSNNKPNIRPMGYEILESLGFGALFITYRNIANNCPLALWWGDPTYPSSHPFRKWYPLFPRRTNDLSDGIIGANGLSDDVPF